MNPTSSIELRMSNLRWFLNATHVTGCKLLQRASASVGGVRKCFIVGGNVRRRVGPLTDLTVCQNK